MRIYARIVFICLLSSCITSITFAQDTITPKLGFALSGGGAKGLAHVGVLKVLEENGITPDYLTGTSMGSIVGGLYAIGYSPAELEDVAINLEWDKYFNDSYSRKYIPIDQRSKSDRYLLSFAIKNGKLSIPRGLIGGKKIQSLLTKLTASVHDVHDFDDYYCPFRCVATDLATGDAYVFDKGPLRMGIRASMSIPSAFDPLNYDDLLLVDGMMARNLPVEDAWSMGSDIVLGVDVGDPLYKSKDLTSVIKVLEQTTSYILVRSTEQQRAKANLLIDPNLHGYSPTSYNDAQGIIARGEEAALAALPSIKHYLDSIGWVPTLRHERPRNARLDSVDIHEVFYISEDTKTNKALRQLAHLKSPKSYAISDIDETIDLLYASGFFSNIDYELAHLTDTTYSISLKAEGTTNVHVRVGLNYDTDFNAGLLFNITARNQLGHGSLLSGDIRVSEFPGFWLNYSISTKSKYSIGIKAYANGQFIPAQRFSANELVDDFSFHHYTTGIAIQSSVGRQWYITAGIGGEHFSSNPRFSTLEELDARMRRWHLLGQLIRDTYDRTYFPKDGSLSQAWLEYDLNGTYNQRGENSGSTPTTGTITFGSKTQKAFSLSNKWWLDASLGLGYIYTKQTNHLQRFFLGRSIPENPNFFEVYGLGLTEIMPNAMGYARLQIRTEIAGNNYIGLGYNWGKHALMEEFETITAGHFQGFGLELGSITPIGPIRLTTEYNPDLNRFNFSFYGGYRF